MDSVVKNIARFQKDLEMDYGDQNFPASLAIKKELSSTSLEPCDDKSPVIENHVSIPQNKYEDIQEVECKKIKLEKDDSCFTCGDGNDFSQSSSESDTQSSPGKLNAGNGSCVDYDKIIVKSENDYSVIVNLDQAPENSEVASFSSDCSGKIIGVEAVPIGLFFNSHYLLNTKSEENTAHGNGSGEQLEAKDHLISSPSTVPLQPFVVKENGIVDPSHSTHKAVSSTSSCLDNDSSSIKHPNSQLNITFFPISQQTNISDINSNGKWMQNPNVSSTPISSHSRFNIDDARGNSHPNPNTIATPIPSNSRFSIDNVRSNSYPNPNAIATPIPSNSRFSNSYSHPNTIATPISPHSRFNVAIGISKASPNPNEEAAGSTADKDYPKPDVTLTTLIALAIKNSITGSLEVTEIYDFISRHFPYYKKTPESWRNIMDKLLHQFGLFEEQSRLLHPVRILWKLNVNDCEMAGIDYEVSKWRFRPPAGLVHFMTHPANLSKLTRGKLNWCPRNNWCPRSKASAFSDPSLDGPMDTANTCSQSTNGLPLIAKGLHPSFYLTKGNCIPLELMRGKSSSLTKAQQPSPLFSTQASLSSSPSKGHHPP